MKTAKEQFIIMRKILQGSSQRVPNQTDVAKSLNVRRQQLHDYLKRNSIPEKHILNFCNFYKVPPEVILNGTISNENYYKAGQKTFEQMHETNISFADKKLKIELNSLVELLIETKVIDAKDYLDKILTKSLDF